MNTRKTLHESLFHDLSQITDQPIAILGCGAIGSNLALSLVRRGFSNFYLLDKDRAEQHNISTQAYTDTDIGLLKSHNLQGMLLDVNAQIQIESDKRDITNIKSVNKNFTVVIDAFDNKAAREKAIELFPENLLHCGMSENSGSVVWQDKGYILPDDVELFDPCAYPLARTLVELMVIAASEAVLHFLLTGEKVNYLVLGGELAVRRA